MRAHIRDESRGQIVVFHITVSDEEDPRSSTALFGKAPESETTGVDEYWQYYEDCDRWGVVFARLPEVLPKNEKLAAVETGAVIEAGQVQNAAARLGLSVAGTLKRTGRACWIGAKGLAGDFLTYIAAWEFAEVESMQTGYQLQREQPAALLAPLMIRLAMHELARPDVLANPVRWVRHRGLPAVKSIVDRTQVATHLETLQMLSAEMEARRAAQRQAEREAARSFARKVNWYAFLVHRWAVEFERTLDSDTQRDFQRAHTAGVSADSTR